jgi:hypothetical protein
MCVQQTKKVHKVLQCSDMSLLQGLCNSSMLVVVLHFNMLSYTHCRSVTDP